MVWFLGVGGVPGEATRGRKERLVVTENEVVVVSNLSLVFYQLYEAVTGGWDKVGGVYLAA